MTVVFEFGQPAGRVYYIESSRKDSPPLDESKGRLPEAEQSITGIIHFIIYNYPLFIYFKLN